MDYNEIMRICYDNGISDAMIRKIAMIGYEVAMDYILEYQDEIEITEDFLVFGVNRQLSLARWPKKFDTDEGYALIKKLGAYYVSKIWRVYTAKQGKQNAI